MKNCPACGTGELNAICEIRTFHPPALNKPLDIQLAASVCKTCGGKVITRDQRAGNLQALAERKVHYGEWLMGEEILRLRKYYGITQLQASEIFGKGKIAFSRYETESSYPDLSLAKMMSLALRDASFMRTLAAEAGVHLPLLEKRLTASFLQTIANSDSVGQKMDTVGGTNVTPLASGNTSNAFFAKLIGIFKPSMAPDSIDIENVAVCAANDERFALAA